MITGIVEALMTTVHATTSHNDTDGPSRKTGEADVLR
jgi:glyceraldehyde-3-phosphate dehydrogenase/erythrose-4-phosphate dehydrogenase